jgi:hypothetical protein
MTNNHDAEGRLRQNPIPTHPADPAQRGEGDKVVGEPALQTPDYNAPPPPDTVKSTGAAVDPGVGGALGQPPKPAVRSQGLLPTGDDGTVSENQGGGDEVAEEVSADQQSDQARKVGHQ